MASSRSRSDKQLQVVPVSKAKRKRWVLPERLRGELSKVVGKLVSTKSEMLAEVKASRFVVTVGDVVTLDFLEAGRVPDISVVDYRTKRMPMAEVLKKFDRFEQSVVRVRNPAAEISQELWNAIKDGYENPRNLRIVVEGEEDLAALACIALAPENTSVIYGIPNRGATVLHVDQKIKVLVEKVLRQMEAYDWN
jgi:uncharacterized protein (UPF0218 family)